MHDDHYRNSPGEPVWKLEYLKRAAFPNAAVGLVVLLLSLLANVPAWQFLVASAVLGVFVYASWSYATLREHVVWLVPLLVLPCIWVAVTFSAGVSTSVGAIQLLSTLLFIMSMCFLVERAANHAMGGGAA
jgi:hypothetical protein